MGFGRARRLVINDAKTCFYTHSTLVKEVAERKSFGQP